MVRFISYDGKYPNLCSGGCKLERDGMRIYAARGFDTLLMEKVEE